MPVQRSVPCLAPIHFVLMAFTFLWPYFVNPPPRLRRPIEFHLLKSFFSRNIERMRKIKIKTRFAWEKQWLE